MLKHCCSTFHNGDRLIGDKPPYDDQTITHGYCVVCAVLEHKKLLEDIAIIQRKLPLIDEYWESAQDFFALPGGYGL